jgi:hypothetical protein
MDEINTEQGISTEEFFDQIKTVPNIQNGIRFAFPILTEAGPIVMFIHRDFNGARVLPPIAPTQFNSKHDVPCPYCEHAFENKKEPQNG